MSRPSDTRLRAAVRRRLRRLDAELALAFAALFVALGGTSYAAIALTGRSVQDGTVTGADVKDRSLAVAELDGSLRRALAAPAGPAGEAGPRGARGPAGAPGANGATGAAGPAGATGAQGATGPVGPACAPALGAVCRGPQGPAGVAGPAGTETGPQGPPGPQGPAGDAGPVGERGAVGRAGATGLAGQRGPRGRNGITPRGWTSGEVADTFRATVWADEYDHVISFTPPAPTSNHFLITWTGTITSAAGSNAICELFADDTRIGRQIVHNLASGSRLMMQAHFDDSEDPPYVTITGRCGGSISGGTPRYAIRSTVTAVETAN